MKCDWSWFLPSLRSGSVPGGWRGVVKWGKRWQSSACAPVPGRALIYDSPKKQRRSCARGRASGTAHLISSLRERAHAALGSTKNKKKPNREKKQTQKNKP